MSRIAQYLAWLAAIFALAARPALAQVGIAHAEDTLPPVISIAFSPDGKLLAVASGTRGLGELVVWDLASRRPLFVHAENSAVTSVAFAPRGNALAVGMATQNGQLLDPRSGTLIRQLDADNQSVRSVAYNADGTILAIASSDGAIRLLDTETWQPTLALRKHPKAARALAISPDGKWLASAGGDDQQALLWNLQSPETPPRDYEFMSLAYHVAFSPDGRWLAISNWGRDLLLVDPTSGDEVLRVANFASNSAVFSRDGKWLAGTYSMSSVGVSTSPRLPSDDERQTIAKLIAQLDADAPAERRTAAEQLAKLGWLAAAQLREASESPSAEVRIASRELLERARNSPPQHKLPFDGRNVDWECLSFSPDGSMLAGGNWYGVVQLWTTADWKQAGGPLVVEQAR